MKKVVCILISFLLIVSLCSCSKTKSYEDTVDEFVTTINESYSNILRVSAALWAAKAEIVDKTTVSDVGAYLDLYEQAILTGQTSAQSYYDIIDQNENRISELYEKVLDECPQEYTGLDAEATTMYECYKNMLNCITDKIMSFPYWEEDLEKNARIFEDSMNKVKQMIAK